MKRKLLVTLLLICICTGVTATALAQATTQASEATDKKTEIKEQAEEWFAKTTQNYLLSRHDKLAENLELFRRYRSKLPSDKRKDITYINKATQLHRPKWWNKCRSSSNISFDAEIWGRDFTANYMPTHAIGFQAPVGIRDGRIQIIVSWRPSMVDSPEQAPGSLAKKHNLTKGHLQEAIIWHELGHNYVTYFLPVRHVITLYRDHYMLFEKLQEFYADMTSLYHCSPKGRLAAMLLRLSLFDRYDEAECHTRAAHAIGSLILSNVLAEPEKWPSIHFPGEVPDKNAERSTIQYVYRHIDPKWTLAEDRALRDIIHQFIMKKGQTVLRKKGAVPLANHLSFNLMVSEDRKHQKKRDEWIAKKLEGLIASGRADKPNKDNTTKSNGATTKPVRVMIIKGAEDDLELD